MENPEGILAKLYTDGGKIILGIPEKNGMPRHVTIVTDVPPEVTFTASDEYSPASKFC